MPIVQDVQIIVNSLSLQKGIVGLWEAGVSFREIDERMHRSQDDVRKGQHKKPPTVCRQRLM